MSARAWWIALAILLFARFALSLRGLEHGLPEAHEPDVELVRQALHFRGTAAAKPGQLAVYPQLVSRCMSWMPRPSAPPPEAVGPDLREHLRLAARDIASARLCVALIAAAAVPLTWLAARRFLAPGWAFLAAAFVATSLLHFDYSQQARPHAPLATFAAAALVASMALVRRPSPARYVVAGVTAACAVGALHNGVFVLLSGLAAHVLATRGRSARAHLWLAVPLAALGASLVAFYPFLLDGGAADAAESDATAFPHRVNPFDGSGILTLTRGAWDYDPVLWLLAAGGAVLWSVRAVRSRRLGEPATRPELVVLLAGLLPYLLVLAGYSHVFARFLEPVVPFASIVAAWTVREIVHGVRALGRSRVAVAALGGALLALPAATIVRLGTVRSTPDTYSRCAAWLRENANVHRDVVLVSPTISLPLFHVVDRSERSDPWVSPASHFWYRYLWALPVESLGIALWRIKPISRGGVIPMTIEAYPTKPKHAEDIVANLRGDWAVVTAGGTPLDLVRAAVAARGELVQRFSPWADGGEDLPLGLAFHGNALWRRLPRARSVGPMLEVYRLRDER